MSEPVPKKPPRVPPAESDLSQILSHGPAVCAAFGRPLGAFIIYLALNKARRGFIGVTTAVSIAGTFFYNYFLK
jgi:hypothetical protein